MKTNAITTNAITTKLFAATTVWSTLIFSCTVIAADEVKADEIDEIKVTVGQQSSENKDIKRPGRGMSKAQVEQRYGMPDQMTNAVGDPPISSWKYTDYIVYFEYDRVLHSVLK